jgi:hypothetical protein
MYSFPFAERSEFGPQLERSANLPLDARLAKDRSEKVVAVGEFPQRLGGH